MNGEKLATGKIANDINSQWPQVCVPLAQLVGHVEVGGRMWVRWLMSAKFAGRKGLPDGVDEVQ